MHLLITGNMGYLGPILGSHLREVWPEARLTGFDSGLFGDCLIAPGPSPEDLLDAHHFGDVRQFPDTLLSGVDAIIHLAAVSNDPMGQAYESVTDAINHRATVALAEAARRRGVRRFIFASSCSVYGAGGDSPRSESSELAPLTAYARSKIDAERGLASLSGEGFQVTCLRFATACGFSPRLRLDLVLNDFAACAITTRRIEILSDGTPWRPLIDVRDMARALAWACTRPDSPGESFLMLNAGSTEGNYRVSELAQAVSLALPGTEVRVAAEAAPDRRSYRVDFRQFETRAPDHRPRHPLADSVQELIRGLRASGFADPQFRQSGLVRLKRLQALQDSGRRRPDLYWNPSIPPS